VKKFERPVAAKEPIRFEIDDEMFEAAPQIGASILQDMIEAANLQSTLSVNPDGLNKEAMFKVAEALSTVSGKAMNFLDAVLLPESRDRFAVKMRATENPITIEMAFEVWRWLMEQYGSRPTGPSLSSPNGHDGTGTSWTGGLLPGVSTPESSTATDTSTSSTTSESAP